MFDKKYIKKLENSPGWPDKSMLEKGAVAVLECLEEIPCNPCETVCPKNSITVGYPITNLPKFNNLCTGCGKCVVICPGLAIFLINRSYSKNEATVTIPYEFLPLPNIDERVSALDRAGNFICEGTVLKVRSNKNYNKTVLVTIVVPKEYSDEVRFFSLRRDK